MEIPCRRAVADASRGAEKLSSYYPQLFRRRPSTAATRVNNFKATDVASVSKVIHTDNQLHPGQFGKAAYTGWIRGYAFCPIWYSAADDLSALYH